MKLCKLWKHLICDIDGVPVLNMIPLFGVAKKVDGIQKGVISAAAGNIRLIADCKQRVNKYTIHRGRGIDDQQAALNKIGNATKNGLIISLDISEAFHSIRLDESLWPYFCVDHPKIGPCYYRRAAQGWASAPQFCREFLMLIFGKFRKNMVRYADDIILGADNWEEFFELLEALMETIDFKNNVPKTIKLAPGTTTCLGKACFVPPLPIR